MKPFIPQLRPAAGISVATRLVGERRPQTGDADGARHQASSDSQNETGGV